MKLSFGDREGEEFAAPTQRARAWPLLDLSYYPVRVIIITFRHYSRAQWSGFAPSGAASRDGF